MGHPARTDPDAEPEDEVEHVVATLAAGTALEDVERQRKGTGVGGTAHGGETSWQSCQYTRRSNPCRSGFRGLGSPSQAVVRDNPSISRRPCDSATRDQYQTRCARCFNSNPET